MDKADLRKELKQTRASIPQEQRIIRSEEICSEIISSNEYQESFTIFCYYPFRTELNTMPLIRNILTSCRTLLLPVIQGTTLEAVQVINIEELVQNNYGIPEPAGGRVMNSSEIDLVIVPALGFTSNGYRIGYGGGFYDRFLKDFRGCSIGPQFKELAIDDRFTPETWDIAVRRVLFG
jgi:5-formyltetrahydrofolate cyclo-ligase